MFLFKGKYDGDKWFLKEKIIMLIGVIGLGKSIFVDGIVNYFIGVNFEDLFWFIVLLFENEEIRIEN